MRMVLASTLIAASFLSAYVISSSANHSTLYWSARKDLISGSQIRAQDVEAVPAALSKSAELYVKANSQTIGFLVVRSVKRGEFVPRASLDSNRQLLSYVSLPISVQRSDLPSNLREGEIVNVYQVGDPNLVSAVIAPLLVLSKVGLMGIDKSGSNMGGSQTLTLAVRTSDVLSTLKATSIGRLVIVRVNG